MFYELSKEGYNGVMRQLLKLYLEQMNEVIHAILECKASDGHGYLLAIFEKHAAEQKVPRDRFDLLGFKEIMVSDADLSQLNMTEPAKNCSICELNRVKLKDSPEIKSKHIVICVTGFL